MKAEAGGLVPGVPLVRLQQSRGEVVALGQKGTGELRRGTLGEGGVGGLESGNEFEAVRVVLCGQFFANGFSVMPAL